MTSAWPTVVGTLGGAVVGAAAGLTGQRVQWRRQRRDDWQTLQREKCAEIVKVLNACSTSNDPEFVGQRVADLYDLLTELSIIAPHRIVDLTSETAQAALEFQSALTTGNLQDAQKCQGSLQERIVGYTQTLNRYFQPQ